MKNLKKYLALALAMVMVLGCLTGCGSSKTEAPKEETKTEAPAKEETKTEAPKEETKTEETSGDVVNVKLGLIGPLTGDYASYGTSAANGAQIAVDEINAAGGVNGVKFELDKQDSQGDPDSAVSAYGKMMDNGMNVSLGCVLSGEAASVITTAREDDILIVTTTSSAKACIEGNENAFRVCFNDPAQGTASANYIADNGLGTKIAVFYQSDIDYSIGLFETFQAQAEVRGLEIVAEQTFTEGSATDFSTQINAIRDSGCEVVFLPIYYAQAAAFLTQAQGKLEGVTFFGCDGLDGLQNEISDTALIEGVMMLTPFSADAEDELTKTFVATYKERHNAIPDQFAADGYDGVYAVKVAMEKCGKTPADADFTSAMVAAMHEITVNGLTGAMSWDADREPNKPAKAMVFQADGSTVLFGE